MLFQRFLRRVFLVLLIKLPCLYKVQPRAISFVRPSVGLFSDTFHLLTRYCKVIFIDSERW